MKIVLFTIALLVSLTSEASEMILKGEIVGKYHAKEVLISLPSTLAGKNIYKLPVENGLFELRGTLAYPGLALIRTEETQQEFGLWLDNTAIEAIFEIYQHPEFGNSLFFSTNSAKGSTDVEFYTNLYNDVKKANQDHSLAASQKMEKLRQIIEEYIQQHPASYLSLHLAQSYMDEYAFGEGWGKKYLSMLDGAVLDSEPARDLFRKIKRDDTNRPGNIVADFHLPDANGRLVSLSSFKARYILLEFWSSWCGPCRKENPALASIYNVYREKGLEIVSISLDDTKEHWLNAIQKDGLTWPQLCDLQGWKGPVGKQFNLAGIPYNILLDENRKIVAVGLHGEELTKELAKRLLN
jgi:thiol-disulfide isomerase/thioredoxin